MNIKSILKKKLVKTKIEKITMPCLIGNLLNGRNALITGGSSGIGFAIAESFLKNGANVIISSREISKLETAKKLLIDKCQCTEDRIELLVLDITCIEKMQKDLRNFLETKTVDIFVNNAGVNGGDLFPNTLEKDYDKVLDTNLKGTYFISQEIAQYMINKKIQGNILNITSSSALRPGISPYIISKWGERSLTLGLAKKYLSYGIIVNGLAPGPTSTPMMNMQDEKDLYLEYTPSKRYAAPEEMGNLATILVSDMGRMIVGDTIYATGGAGLITYDDTTY